MNLHRRNCDVVYCLWMNGVAAAAADVVAVVLGRKLKNPASDCLIYMIRKMQLLCHYGYRDLKCYDLMCVAVAVSVLTRYNSKDCNHHARRIVFVLKLEQ